MPTKKEMATYYFVGDSVEILACDTFEANARHTLATIRKKNPNDDPEIYQIYSRSSDEMDVQEKLAAKLAGYEV